MFKPLVRLALAAATSLAFASAAYAQTAGKLAPHEGDAILRDVHFGSGEHLAEVRMHYQTLGEPRRDASGRVVNAVLLLHGTGGGYEAIPNIASPLHFRNAAMAAQSEQAPQ